MHLLEKSNFIVPSCRSMIAGFRIPTGPRGHLSKPQIWPSLLLYSHPPNKYVFRLENVTRSARRPFNNAGERKEREQCESYSSSVFHTNPSTAPCVTGQPVPHSLAFWRN